MSNSAIAPVALFSLCIGTEDACLPVGREDRKAQISIWHQLLILPFLPTGKVADNHINLFGY
jgi:hypothetical protein